MNQEIERKFLVSGDTFRREAFQTVRITQGYLNSDPARTVRVRLWGEEGFLTVKGLGSTSGMSRFEWEKPISREDALALLPLCEKGVIDKTRHLVKVGAHTFEVDVFHGENEGLVLAEVELGSEDESFEKPSWLGEEVTGDKRYYNSYLASHPYCQW